MSVATYPREHISLFDMKRRLIYGQRFSRECGCNMMIGLTLGGSYPDDAQVALTACDEHGEEMNRVLRKIQSMPPSDDKMDDLFTRLLEEEIRNDDD